MKKILTVAAVVALLAVVVAPATRAAVYTNDNVATAYTPETTSRDYVKTATLNLSSVPCASNDYVKVIGLAAKTVVRWVEYEVTTTNTAVGVRTFDIGDPDAEARWVAAASIAAIGSGVSQPSNHLGTAAGGIYVQANDAITSGVITVRAACTDVGK